MNLLTPSLGQLVCCKAASGRSLLFGVVEIAF